MDSDFRFRVVERYRERTNRYHLAASFMLAMRPTARWAQGSLSDSNSFSVPRVAYFGQTRYSPPFAVERPVLTGRRGVSF